MKKKIIISSSGLKIGGMEKLLVEYINFIQKDKVYDIELILMSDFGGENTLLKNVDSEISVNIIKSKTLLEKKNILKKNKKILGRLKYSFFLKKEKRFSHIKYKKVLKNLKNSAVLIDFDASLFKFKKETKKFKKIVFIHTSLGSFLEDESMDIDQYGKNLDNYNKIIVVSKEMKKEVERLYPYLENKIELIYNSLDFSNIIEKSKEKDILTCKEKELLSQKYFLSVARLDTKHKDFKTLIKSYKILKRRGFKQKLYIVGTGDGEEEIRSFIKELSLETDIILLGGKQNPYVWMKYAELFIHSSNFEGFGLVLLEAGILGKVVISSDCPVGPKEILENGKSGVLFEMGNFEELADKIIMLVESEELRKNFIKNISISVNRFKIDSNLKKLYSVIENIK